MIAHIVWNSHVTKNDQLYKKIETEKLRVSGKIIEFNQITSERGHRNIYRWGNFDGRNSIKGEEIPSIKERQRIVMEFMDHRGEYF